MEEAAKMPGEWDASEMRSALLSPVIAGLSRHMGVDYGKGRWEPILDLATWNRVGAILRDESRKPPRARGRRVTRLAPACSAVAFRDATVHGE